MDTDTKKSATPLQECPAESVSNKFNVINNDIEFVVINHNGEETPRKAGPVFCLSLAAAQEMTSENEFKKCFAKCFWY